MITRRVARRTKAKLKGFLPDPIQIRQEEYLRLLKKNTVRNLVFPEKLSMNVLDYFI